MMAPAAIQISGTSLFHCHLNFKMKRYSLHIVVICGMLGMIACTKGLEVKNENEPGFEQVYANGEDLENLTAGLFNTWYGSINLFGGPYMTMAVAADNVTCSWGNVAMWDMSREPRTAWDNSPNYSHEGVTKVLFDQMYSVINTASNILKAIEKGVDIGPGGNQNDQVKAFCKFAQGISYGNLALFFDKGFIVDEKISMPGATIDSAVSYNEVAAAAIGYLDAAIALCANNFTIPKEWMGTSDDLTNDDLKKLCNSFAARFLANMPRNKAGLATVNWAKVKSYADAGITEDYIIQMDGWNRWYASGSDFLTTPGWGKADMYVVHLMDPAQPQHWDDDENFPTPPESTNPPDNRLLTDFEYSGTNWFRPERGYYHYSNYRYSRYDATFALGTGPIPEFLLSENDTYRAEARAYTNDLAGAAGIINAGTRITRGNLPAVAANFNEIVKALHHERHVEMYVTACGLQFYEMRKQDLLQKGTPLHWPLPAKTLETFGVSRPFYTFGGVANADGINTSNGGWR
jgi:starch-binding outer membrane protein, SusD/RagB family